MKKCLIFCVKKFHLTRVFVLDRFYLLLWWRRKWERTGGKKRTEEKRREREPPSVKEMPIAATGAPPATTEPRVRPRVPAGVERVPKRAPQGEYVAPEAALVADRLHGVSASSAATSHPLHPSPPALSPQPMATEPPRTRSRSRSGFYQGAGANSGAGSSGANLHLLHHHQQQQHHQLSGACAGLGAHGHPENLRTPAGMLSPGGHRHPGPGVHRSPGGAGTALIYLVINLHQIN